MDNQYSVEQLTLTLKDARVAEGISQRELAERAGLGQNRLASIEMGRVDLRASTLVQLARALDLELVLVPRRVLPAVQALTGFPPEPPREAGRRSVRGTPIRVLRHIQQHLVELERAYPASKDLAQTKRAAQALIESGSTLDAATLQPLRRSVHWLGRARMDKEQAQPFLAKAAAQLQELRRMMPPAVAHLEQLPQPQRAAYGLEDEIS